MDLSAHKEDARSNLIEWAKEVIVQIKEEFANPDDDWMYTLLGSDAQGRTSVIGVDPAFFNDEAQKDVLAEKLLPELIKAHSLVALCQVISTWQLRIDKPESEDLREMEAEAHKYGKIANHPDRYEALLVMASDRFGDEAYQAEIIRHEDTGPTLGEWEELPSDMSGRFIEPIRRAIRPQG